MPTNTRNSPDNHIISTLRAEITKMRDELSAKIDDMKAHFDSVLAEKDVEIQRISCENRHLRESLVRLEEKLDDSDAYERRDCIVLSGDLIPEATTGENCKEVSLQLIKEKLRINLQSSDVSTAHRLGRKPTTQGPDKRKLILKLCRRDLKRDIIAACKELKPGFYVNESLTPTRNAILFALRRMRRSTPDSPVKGTATIDGRVFVWVKPPGSSRDQRLLINTMSSLREFSLKYMNKPLNEYLQDASV